MTMKRNVSKCLDESLNPPCANYLEGLDSYYELCTICSTDTGTLPISLPRSSKHDLSSEA